MIPPPPRMIPLPVPPDRVGVAKGDQTDTGRGVEADHDLTGDVGVSLVAVVHQDVGGDEPLSTVVDAGLPSPSTQNVS